MPPRTAFTLVELIVVITILSILSTIGFVSFASFRHDAKSAKYSADFDSIQKGFELYRIENGNFPLPDDGIEIRNDENELVFTQGFIGKDIALSIPSISDIYQSNKDAPYQYSLLYTGKEYQLAPPEEMVEETSRDSIKSVGNYNSVFTITHTPTFSTIHALPSILSTNTTLTVEDMIAQHEYLLISEKDSSANLYNTAPLSLKKEKIHPLSKFLSFEPNYSLLVKALLEIYQENTSYANNIPLYSSISTYNTEHIQEKILSLSRKNTAGIPRIDYNAFTKGFTIDPGRTTEYLDIKTGKDGEVNFYPKRDPGGRVTNNYFNNTVSEEINLPMQVFFSINENESVAAFGFVLGDTEVNQKAGNLFNGGNHGWPKYGYQLGNSHQHLGYIDGVYYQNPNGTNGPVYNPFTQMQNIVPPENLHPTQAYNTVITRPDDILSISISADGVLKYYLNDIVLREQQIIDLGNNTTAKLYISHQAARDYDPNIPVITLHGVIQ